MSNFLITLQQTGIMFLMMAVGFVLCKTKLLREAGTDCLAALLLNLILPCSILNSFLAADASVRFASIAAGFGVCAVAVAIAVLLARLIFRRDAVANFAAAFSNAGFMGIPLIAAVLNMRAVIFAAPFIAIINVLQWTYGVYLFTGDTEGLKLRTLVRNPILISLALGILAALLCVPMPAVITKTVSGFAAMNAPVAMLILGAYIAEVDAKQLLSDRRMYAISLVRLIVIPVVTMLVLKLFPFSDPDICMAIFIAAAAPVGSNVAVYARRCGGDYRYASGTVCVSTIFAILTMPLLALLYGLF